MKNCIYKFMNRDGDVIYIGKAKDLKNRLSSHKHLSQECYEELAYILYASFDTEHEMDFAERYYIQKLTPKYNSTLAGKPISFNCEDLDDKSFDIYEVNQFVVEETLNQIESLQKEELIFNMDISIVEFVGMINISTCKKFRDITYKEKNVKSYNYIKEIANKSLTKISNEFKNEFKNKYNFLDLQLRYKDTENINEYIDFANNEYLCEIKYKEKYKDDYKSKDAILKCK